MPMQQHKKMKYIYIGIDCHKKTHTATAINCFNEKLVTLTFNNDKVGYQNLIKTISKYKENEELIFGLEDTKHLGYGLASYLLENKYFVKHINSNLTYVERKKNPIITKNDEFDSMCIAKVLLDELDNIPFVQSDEIYWTLKQLVKMRKSIVENNIESKNKFHAQIMHHYPNYKELFSCTYSKTSLEFFKKYPSPNLLKDTSVTDLTTFLLTHSKGRFAHKKATEILELIQENNFYNQEYQSERNVIITLLINQIQNNDTRLEEIESEIIKVYDKVGCTLHTYPCLDKISASYILAEIGNINRFISSAKLAKYAGIAPIERSSGSIEKGLKNEFGNRELNTFIYKLACRSLLTGRYKDKPFNAIFLDYYTKKISEGKTKHQAIICVMRRITNILYTMLKKNVDYVHPQELSNQCTKNYLENKAREEEKQKKKQSKNKKKTLLYQ